MLEKLGTESNKFEHVRRNLKANRPAILNTAVDDGRPSRKLTNHYVVIEKARKRQEKVKGKWRDRDVEYYINFGWGDKEREWISVRQRGRQLRAGCNSNKYLSHQYQ